MGKLPAGRKAWRGLREFALGLPGAWEDFPWGEVVVKVNTKVFVFLGTEDADSAAVSLKLSESHEHALSLPGAVPTGYGLGKSGWVTVPIAADAAQTDLLRDWVEESYRKVAPKKLVAELDGRGP